MKNYLDILEEILKEFNMKFYAFLLLLFIFSACTNQSAEIVKDEPDTCDCKSLNLDRDYNRFYLNDRKKPYTGTCKLIENNILKSKRDLVEGKYDGELVDFYDNGQVKMTMQYKKHFINGDVKRYSIDGKLIGHTVYKQSRLIETKL
jgi:hypothetical protein